MRGIKESEKNKTLVGGAQVEIPKLEKALEVTMYDHLIKIPKEMMVL